MSFPSSIDLVMPLILRHWGYFENFWRTYQWNWFVPGQLILMVRGEEAPEIRDRMKSMAGMSPANEAYPKIVTKQTLIGHRNTKMSGPFRAMACKLAACNIVNTQHYMVIDADCLVMRRVRSLQQLAGRVNVSARKRDHFYDNAAKFLGVPPMPEALRTVSLKPPMIYNAVIAKDALMRLGITSLKIDSNEPPRTRWCLPLDTMVAWSEKAPWAEVFLHETLRAHIQERRVPELTAGELTEEPIKPNATEAGRRMQFADWMPNDKLPFAVIHSYHQVDPKLIWDKVRGYLGIDERSGL